MRVRICMCKCLYLMRITRNGAALPRGSSVRPTLGQWDLRRLSLCTDVHQQADCLLANLTWLHVPLCSIADKSEHEWMNSSSSNQ